MKALLINGPRHLTTLNLDKAGLPPVIVIPKPTPINIADFARLTEPPPYPTFETVVYRQVNPLPIGGFILYLAEGE